MIKTLLCIYCSVGIICLALVSLQIYVLYKECVNNGLVVVHKSVPKAEFILSLMKVAIAFLLPIIRLLTTYWALFDDDFHDRMIDAIWELDENAN